MLFGGKHRRLEQNNNPAYTRAPWTSDEQGTDAPDDAMDDDNENDQPATGALPSTAVEKREPENATIHRVAFPQAHRRQNDFLHSLRAPDLWFGG